MLPAYLKEFTGCCFLSLCLVYFCAIFAYVVNSRRKPDDPQKRDYSPFSPWITPLTIPFVIIINLMFLVLGSLFAITFLIAFPLCLIFARSGESLLIKWLIKVGEKILKINTEILKVLGLYQASSS